MYTDPTYKAAEADRRRQNAEAIGEDFRLKLDTYPYNVVWTHDAAHLHEATKVAQTLPHGSGIDGAWTVSQSEEDPRTYVCANSYHGMDEAGFYVAWVDFEVTVKVTDAGVKVLDVSIEECLGDWPFCYGLDDYLWETVYWYMGRNWTMA